MSKHTPGPWRCWRRAETHSYTVLTDDTVIARIVDNTQEADANARLIAAAPDLLAALEHVRASAQTGTYDGGVVISFAAFESVRAALERGAGTP